VLAGAVRRSALGIKVQRKQLGIAQNCPSVSRGVDSINNRIYVSSISDRTTLFWLIDGVLVERPVLPRLQPDIHKGMSRFAIRELTRCRLRIGVCEERSNMISLPAAVLEPKRQCCSFRRGSYRVECLSHYDRSNFLTGSAG